MIARLHRFHGYNSLRYTHQKGMVLRGQYCSLKYVRNDRRSSYRVAVVVSKKVSKSAVVRNRIRRRIYEAVRAAMVPNEPYDLIFSVYSEHLARCSPTDLREVVVSKLRRAHIRMHAP